MGHKSKPRDSCGGAKSCGGNLLVSGVDESTTQEKPLQRNVKAMVEVVRSFSTAVTLRRAR